MVMDCCARAYTGMHQHLSFPCPLLSSCTQSHLALGPQFCHVRDEDFDLDFESPEVS